MGPVDSPSVMETLSAVEAEESRTVEGRRRDEMGNRWPLQ